MALYTCSLQYEDSTSCTLYRSLLSLRRQVDSASFFAVAQIFHPQQKVILSAFPCRFSSSIHPSILSTTSFSLSQRCFTRIPRLCQVQVSSSSYSPILDRLSIHSRFLVFINPSTFCSLGEYVSRPLLRRSTFYFRFSLGSVTLDPEIEYAALRFVVAPSAPEKASHRFRLCLVSLRTSLVFLDLAINSFLSRTILVSNLVPLRLLPLFFSVVFTLYSPRYPQCLRNIVDTL